MSQPSQADQVTTQPVSIPRQSFLSGQWADWIFKITTSVLTIVIVPLIILIADMHSTITVQNQSIDNQAQAIEKLDTKIERLEEKIANFQELRGDIRELAAKMEGIHEDVKRLEDILRNRRSSNSP